MSYETVYVHGEIDVRQGRLWIRHDVPRLARAITQGETREEVFAEAADCLEEAIATRIDDGRDIPSPSAPKRGELTVSVPPSMALKAAVYLPVREAGIGNSEFMRRILLESGWERHKIKGLARHTRRRTRNATSLPTEVFPRL
jgi:predicted RNase H-like HicB family nuclease